MIGADTNILARAFLDDDKKQSQEAQEFLAKVCKNNELFISSYAILEFAWVLKVKKFSRQRIYHAISTLCNSYGAIIGNHNQVVSALEMYNTGKADFGDYMILSEGIEYKATRLKTFDKLLAAEIKQ